MIPMGKGQNTMTVGRLIEAVRTSEGKMLESKVAIIAKYCRNLVSYTSGHLNCFLLIFTLMARSDITFMRNEFLILDLRRKLFKNVVILDTVTIEGFGLKSE